ncbi:MAG: phage terminase small subunit P27 family [Gallionellaceae bacterium]
MGARGPKPLPSNVHMLRNNPSKKPAGQLMDSLQPEIEIPGCPTHLLPDAKKEWKRIAPELERYGLISKLDRAALQAYCQSYAEMVFAEKRLNAEIKREAQKRETVEAAGAEYDGGDGFMVKTVNGNLVYSHWWVIANKARQQVDRFLANFGMSPSSRGRVNPSNHLQRSLFDDEEGGESAGGFGAI